MNKRVRHIAKNAAFAGYLMFMTVSCNPNDSQIAKAITAATAIAPHVTANVQHGVVTLNGVVRGTVAKSTLDSTVKSVKGVVSVIDNASFEPPPPPPPSATPYPMHPSDTLAAKGIAMSLKAWHISGVKATVVNDIVTLTGNASKKDLRTIMIIANQYHPKKVINKMTVK